MTLNSRRQSCGVDCTAAAYERAFAALPKPCSMLWLWRRADSRDDGVRLSEGGFAIGVPVALAATRAIASQLFGIRATDPLTFGAVAVLLLVVALAACYIPVQRAVRVDPMVALRYE